MQTKSIYLLVLILGVILIGSYVLAQASCADEITYTPPSRLDLAIIKGSKSETYTYANKDYSTKGSALVVCVSTKFNF